MSYSDEQPTFNDTQLSEYFARIFAGCKKPPSLATIKAKAKSEPLETLALIQLRHLSTIPWNSVALHYAQSKSISLEPSNIFAKLVGCGHGGYCMETNGLLAIVLRSLGYDLYLAGARISASVDLGFKRQAEPGFRAFEHMVIVLFINGTKYHVDAGFANFGPVSPMVLEETPEGKETAGAPGIDVRFRYRDITNNTRKEQKYWVLETRNASDKVWRDGYCFTEMEFLAQDFQNISYRTHRDPTSWFTFIVICTRVLCEEKNDDDGSLEAVGTVTLMGDTLTKRVGPTASETVTVCHNESERVKVLEEWFGIHLTEDDVKGIEGMTSAIVVNGAG